MTHKLEPVTSNIRVGFDENSDKYVIYKIGDDFPYCYSRIASFGREVDAVEWYKRVNNHETLLASLRDLIASHELCLSNLKSNMVKKYGREKAPLSALNGYVREIEKATETLNKIKGE